MLQGYLRSASSYIWDADINDVQGYKRLLLLSLRTLHCVIKDFLDGMLTLQAMSLVYTTLLSIVPLIAVSFSVLKGFGVHNQIEPWLYNLLTPLGDKGVEVTQRIIEFVENTRAGVLGSLGLVLLFYTVISLIQKVEKSFNYTWRVTEHRPIAQRFSDYLSVVLLGPLLIFSALGITASILESSAIQQLMGYESIGWLFHLIGRLIPYILVITAFTVIYLLVPNTRVVLKAALGGAVVAGVLWETIGWAFASFIVTSAKYTAIYSTFATLIFFMIWLYLCWMILLIGASIAFYIQHPEYLTLHARHFNLSNRMKEKLALLVMIEVCRNFYNSQNPLDSMAIAGKVQVTPEMIQPIVKQLQKSKILVRTEGLQPGLLPGRPPETIMVMDIINIIRSAGEHTNCSMQQLPANNRLDTFLGQLEGAYQNHFGQVTLKELALESHSSRPLQSVQN